jgi:hypothetical protein
MRARGAQRYQPRQRPPARGLAGLFDAVASTIQTVEGWFPGSVSYRLNNPGNLLYAGQPGAVPHPITGSDGKVRTFAEFSSVAAGQQALDNQIALDASRGLTISQFAQKYAPAQDSNDPTSYAARIAAAAGLSVNDPLSAAGSAAASVPVPPDESLLAANDTPFWSVDVVGQPWRGNEAGALDVSPVAWATLGVIGALYVASTS